jgi:ribosomal protein L24
MTLPEKAVLLPKPKDWVEIVAGKLRGTRGRVFLVYQTKVDVEYTRKLDDGTFRVDSVQVEIERVRVLLEVP